jgi:hypothetical protein
LTAPRRASGIAAGLALSLLVALRSGSFAAPGETPKQASWTATLVLLWAAASLLVVPIGLWIRRAPLKDPASVDRAVLLGTALSALPLALFGGVLKSSTHHRPLGGTTFAVVACIVLTLCIGLAVRVGRGRASSNGSAWLAHSFRVACLGSAVAALALGLGRSHALVLVDGVTLGCACAAAGLLKIPTKLAALPGVVAGALWALLLSGGLLLTARPDLMSEARLRAPVSFAAFSWLGVGS